MHLFIGRICDQLGRAVRARWTSRDGGPFYFVTLFVLVSMLSKKSKYRGLKSNVKTVNEVKGTGTKK